MKAWKNTDQRALYIGAVIGKLRMEGKTHLTLEQVEQVLRDAFQVETADDLAADYYLMTANKDYKIEGPLPFAEAPLPFAEACNRASAMADRDQCDVSMLQAFDTFYFIDY